MFMPKAVNYKSQSFKGEARIWITNDIKLHIHHEINVNWNIGFYCTLLILNIKCNKNSLILSIGYEFGSTFIVK